MPAILAPADSPFKMKFTLGNATAELDLESRRAYLLGAFDGAADVPAESPTRRRGRRAARARRHSRRRRRMKKGYVILIIFSPKGGMRFG